METTGTKCIHLPELNLRDNEIRQLLGKSCFKEECLR